MNERIDKDVPSPQLNRISLICFKVNSALSHCSPCDPKQVLRLGEMTKHDSKAFGKGSTSPRQLLEQTPVD